MAIANLSPSLSLRALRWKHPSQVRYPNVIELGLSRAVAALDKPQGPQFRAIFGEAPVPGKDRERRKRIDGATNVVTLICTLIASADISRGLVATPAGDHWKRKTWSDVDTLGFGAPVPGERSIKRTERAAAELEAQGFIRTDPWKVPTEQGFRSLPGLKFVTDKLWKALGLLDAVRSERRRRSQRKGEERLKALGVDVGKTRPPAEKKIPPALPVDRPSVPLPSPPATRAGPTTASDAAAAAFAALKKHFGK